MKALRSTARLAPLLLLLLGSCWTTRTTERMSVSAEPAVIRHATPTRAWSLGDEVDTPLGYVVLFEVAEEDQRAVYMVRNRWHQDLGMIDSLGRAWRYQLHEDEAEWIATGTVLDGARAILRAGEGSHLDEVDLPNLTSAAHRP